MKYQDDACDTCKDACVKSGTKGGGRVGEDTIYGKVEHFPHVKFGYACMPCRRLKFDAGGFKSKPAHDAADEAAVFTELKENVECFSVHETEVGTPWKDRGL